MDALRVGILIVALISLVGARSQVREKPGRCPKQPPGFVGICLARCSGDYSCPGKQKCCGNCPLECMDPVEEPAIEKPGSCPRQTGIGPCVVRCSNDYSCPGTQKCCGSCPRQCTNVDSYPTPPPPPPPAPKKGRCPVRSPDSIGTCDVRCFGDHTCPGKQKCCGSCPRACEDPVFEKPGRCPRYYRFPYESESSSLHCRPECTNDYACSGRKKCCGKGCRRRCVNPFPRYQLH